MRSVLAAACLTHLDGERFVAHACGAPGQLAGEFHPAALDALTSARLPLPSGQPMSWDALLRGASLRPRFAILLDESIAPLVPAWPGQPDVATWPLPDVAAMPHAQEAAHMAIQVLYSLQRRIELLNALTLHSSDRAAIRSDIRELGRMD